MKRFDTFGAYMFDLLFAPLKKSRESANQFRIFFRVVGRIFDGMKKDVFRVRSEANVASASHVMLPVHGQDRDMPRLPGEDMEAYRTRLSMKGIISQWAGTKKGLLYALTSLGYDKSELEPVSLQDPDRWAEFIIYLESGKQSGINNLLTIDAEVQKIKEGSSKPAYGIKASGIIQVGTGFHSFLYGYPLCGEIACGVFPHEVSEGRLIESTMRTDSLIYAGEARFPRVGTVAASELRYQETDYVRYEGFSSMLKLLAENGNGNKEYELCSPNTYLNGGND